MSQALLLGRHMWVATIKHPKFRNVHHLLGFFPHEYSNDNLQNANIIALLFTIYILLQFEFIYIFVRKCYSSAEIRPTISYTRFQPVARQNGVFDCCNTIKHDGMQVKAWYIAIVQVPSNEFF